MVTVTRRYVDEHEKDSWIGYRVDCSECGHVFHGATESGSRTIRVNHLRRVHGVEPEEVPA